MKNMRFALHMNYMVQFTTILSYFETKETAHMSKNTLTKKQHTIFFFFFNLTKIKCIHIYE